MAIFVNLLTVFDLCTRKIGNSPRHPSLRSQRTLFANPRVIDRGAPSDRIVDPAVDDVGRYNNSKEFKISNAK
jgi:hypothetical protein